MPLDLAELQQAEIATLRERIRQLEAMLAPAGFAVPLEWGLTPKEGAVVSGMAGDQPEPKIVDVFVCKLRPKMKRFGVTIQTIWGQGYGIVDREKVLARAAA